MTRGVYVQNMSASAAGRPAAASACRQAGTACGAVLLGTTAVVSILLSLGMPGLFLAPVYLLIPAVLRILRPGVRLSESALP